MTDLRREREIEATVIRHYELLDRLLAERQISLRCYDIGCAAVMDWEAQELEKIGGRHDGGTTVSASDRQGAIALAANAE